ncbi:GDSL esterase/lipase [Canna indica]|uniref:GDSL esterase/lipase n=1 Tax=Canna indica TaxID=4628 RepID=A0AAQ3KEE8_9LILI|nr:GDSL esterase/lipase [Canna indica]
MAKKIPALISLYLFFVASLEPTYVFGDDLLAQRPAATAPALYVFGDSTADVGNNNFRPQDAPKANFAPYGIDFSGRIPTGRFSNGFIGVDYIARAMGLAKSPPPFLAVNSSWEMLRGVNLASAGSGILDNTGKDVIAMVAQVKDFEAVASNLTACLGEDIATFKLGKSLFFFSVGSNDLFAQYPLLSRIGDAQKDQIVAFIVNKFKHQLKRLYALGARKYAVAGTGMIGCVPALRLQSPSGDCDEKLNDLSLRFKKATRAILEELSLSLDGFKYSFLDAYELGVAVEANPHMFGFTEVKSACCGGGRLKAETSCGEGNATYCGERRRYYFWDNVHPTQAVYKLSAQVSLYGPPRLANPVNIHDLLLC